MLLSVTLFLFTFSLECSVGKTLGDSQHAHHRRHASMLRPRNNTMQYTLTDMYQGQSFLTDWDFATGGDPTHGSVKYLSASDAASKGLAFVQDDGTATLAVDDTETLPLGAQRASVRISTKKKYSGGLFIADFFAMPHGCSVWPAYWSVGPNWPGGGEIDILEGVHDQPTNQYTLHTSSGCTLSTDGKEVSGKTINTQCASSANDNSGCGFLDSDTRSYGEGFNLIAGGVYAHLWNSNGIQMWHFPRTMIPGDITAKAPNPSQWGSPVAFWSSSSCDMASHFYEHSLVLDTTICGDWAGPTYASAGCPGTCEEAVANPKNYVLAKWKLNYIAVYQ